MPSRTHHATCAFRLSCGCIAEYNSFPEARQPTVLCGNCGKSATIDFRYLDDSVTCHVTCRASKPGGGSIRVRCGKRKGHKGSKHFDPSVKMPFILPAKLKSGRTGST